MEKDRLFSLRSLGLQTAHAYHFGVALRRLWNLNISIAEDYLNKWISWASRSRINSAVVQGLNNRISTAFKSSYGFKAQEYRDTTKYLLAVGL
ncbi:MAG: hypothetical protein QXU18_08380 [Thermoplasmatales archaeon]